LADLIDKCNRVVEERGYRFSSDEEHSDAILSVGYFKILVCGIIIYPSPSLLKGRGGFFSAKEKQTHIQQWE